MTNEHNKKVRINWKRVIITGVVFIAFIALIVVLIVTISHKKHNGKEKETSPNNVDIDEILNNNEYIKIQSDDCTMYVGTIAKLTYESNPLEYANNAIWTSSDEEIVTVDKGTVYVKAAGKAAITATFGVYSDSVIIAAVDENDDSTTETEYPIVEVVNGVVKAPDKPVNMDSDDDAPAESAPADETTAPADRPDVVPNDAPNDTPADTPNDAPVSDVKLQDSINSQMTGLGFKQYTSGTYTYYEDKNYLGEAIVDDNSIQIYVKTRTTGFDQSLKNLLKIVLPTEYENVFNVFTKTEGEKTFKADGHKVNFKNNDKSEDSRIYIYY